MTRVAFIDFFGVLERHKKSTQYYVFLFLQKSYNHCDWFSCLKNFFKNGCVLQKSLKSSWICCCSATILTLFWSCYMLSHLFQCNFARLNGLPQHSKRQIVSTVWFSFQIFQSWDDPTPSPGFTRFLAQKVPQNGQNIQAPNTVVFLNTIVFWAWHLFLVFTSDETTFMYSVQAISFNLWLGQFTQMLFHH